MRIPSFHALPADRQAAIQRSAVEIANTYGKDAALDILEHPDARRNWEHSTVVLRMLQRDLKGEVNDATFGQAAEAIRAY